MSGDTVTGGATTVTSISAARIRVSEIRFVNVAGTEAVTLWNNVRSDLVPTTEWERSIARRLIKPENPYMNGTDVEAVQQCLVDMGKNIGSAGVDGLYGPDTEAAVRTFQQDHGLLRDGIVGPETRSFLGLQGPACYPINTSFVIEARFTAPATVTSADIWADDRRDGFGGLGADGNPGQRVTVTFSGGTSGFHRFMIRTQQTSILKHRVQWAWRCGNVNGTGSGATHLGKSEHLIYSVLRTPQEPMDLPWIGVLHKACVWAVNQTDEIGAASRVTEQVNSGRGVNNNPVLGYAMDTGGAAYSWSTIFDCSEYLSRLNGGNGNGEYVNCTDCACMVTTFANALGCELYEAAMGDSSDTFLCNKIIAIGQSRWAPPWEGEYDEGEFKYHEVAWTGSCGNADELYDACLKVDGDADPAVSPHTELLPVNIVFHVAGQIRYKERLTTNDVAGRAYCVPNVGSATRRFAI